MAIYPQCLRRHAAIGLGVFWLAGHGAFAWAATPAVSPLPGEIGTVVRHGDVVCLQIARHNLAPQTDIVVIQTGEIQSDAAGRIIGGVKGCAAEDGMTGYRLRLSRDLLKNGEVGAGIVAKPGAVTMHGKSASVKLPDQKGSLSFRSCASADGIHVTAWRGRPLAGERVWHGYVLLNQDLDADCTDKETA